MCGKYAQILRDNFVKNRQHRILNIGCSSRGGPAEETSVDVSSAHSLENKGRARFRFRSPIRLRLAELEPAAKHDPSVETRVAPRASLSIS